VRLSPVFSLVNAHVTATYTVQDKPLAQVQGEQTARAIAKAKEVIASFTTDYSEWEAMAWPLLITEANQFLQDGTVGPYMQSEIGDKYPTAAILAQVILGKAEVMKDLRAAVIIHRQELEAQIDAATTPQEAADVSINEGWPE
jgi:hypothetical protein